MALKQAITNCGRAKGTAGRDPAITVFRGIPYAKPPVGELRFRPPAEAEGAIQNRSEDRVITYTMEHPGLLESLEGF